MVKIPKWYSFDTMHGSLVRNGAGHGLRNLLGWADFRLKNRPSVHLWHILATVLSDNCLNVLRRRNQKTCPLLSINLNGTFSLFQPHVQSLFPQHAVKRAGTFVSFGNNGFYLYSRFFSFYNVWLRFGWFIEFDILLGQRT